MEQLTKEQRLGSAIRQIRVSLKLPTDWIAYKLHYADKSTYCKLERGEIKNINVWLLIEICELYDCNIVQLFFLADIDIFKTKLKSWTEFIETLSNNDFEEIDILYKSAHPTPAKNKKVTLIT
jgi:hypothetical protein